MNALQRCWSARTVAAATITALALGMAGRAAAPPDDPFSEANKAPGLFILPKVAAAKADPTVELVRFEVKAEPAAVRRGQTFRLVITGTPKAGYHTYPLTQRSDDPAQDPSGLSRLTVTAPPGLQALPPITESEPQFVVEKTGGVFLEHTGPFTWAQDFVALPDARPGEANLVVTIKLQACDETRCVRGQQRFDVPVRVSDEPPVPLTAELEKRLQARPADIRVVAVPRELRDRMTAAAAPAPAAGPAAPARAPAAQPTPAAPAVAPPVGVVQQLLLAGLAGFAMLLTPCVFPMIPITVSFFVKQGEREHHSPVALAFVYTGTIIAVLTAAVLLLGNLIISLANNVWLNLGMGVVLVFFALSLFGMYEIELPHFLTRFTSAREGRGGYIGAFFMALTFTINSFTCTGPFLGPLLSAVKEFQMSAWQVAASALAYSAAFAAPFFLLALFPRLMKSLPKSGGWLNAVKVVMGFLELALALKFLSITDAGLFPGDPQLFNYETVLCTWMALSVACGLYLLGFYRLPHDTPVEHVGVPRLLFACFFLGLAVYMTPLLSRKAPLGTVGKFLVAWLPPDSAPAEVAAGGGRPGSAHLAWYRDYDKAWQEARAAGKLLFIDFTGVNCQNCRFNELTVFPRPEVRAEMEKFTRVQLYTDLVPDRTLSRDEASRQAERNMDWQSNTFGDVSLPLYVVLDPSGTSEPVSDGKLTGQVRGRSAGTISDVAAFVDMLRQAQEKQLAARP